jgi:hypothetical protein
MKEEVIGDSSVLKLQKAGEKDEIVEAYVTLWQELEIQDRIQQLQKLEVQDYTLSKYRKAAEAAAVQISQA